MKKHLIFISNVNKHHQYSLNKPNWLIRQDYLNRPSIFISQLMKQEKKRMKYQQKQVKIKEYIKQGKLQTQIGNYTQAIQVYNQILSIDENNPIAMGELGYTLYCMEDHMQALTQFTKCSQFISIIPKFLNKLGEELYSEYKYNTAKLYYLTAYQIDKGFKNSIFGLIDTCLKLEEYDQSLQYCQILLEMDPNCIEANLRKMKVKILTNKIEEAEEIAKQLDEIQLDYQAQYQLIDLKGLILLKKQQYLDCINYLKDFIDEDKYIIKLIFTTAKCYYKLKRYEEALNHLEMVFDVYQNYYPALQLQNIDSYQQIKGCRINKIKY
ncbi:unnamed protein product [Paramecium primaurelia]|uniref:Tetratricopeptide repeat protein n=1 Tax=Paramecium primaurelia TaxID=5886 RepID=A0A8S1P5B1_PARPR|nr:unnamed protein product [Paramecium primaurelia]